MLARLKALRVRLHEIDEHILVEQHRRLPDVMRLRELKSSRLRIKDEVVRLESCIGSPRHNAM